MTVYDIEFNKPKGSVSINYSDIQTNKTFLSNLQYLKTVNKDKRNKTIKFAR